MRKFIIIALLACFAMAGQGKKKIVVWEQPSTEVNTLIEGYFRPLLEITRVEFDEDETRVMIHIASRPENWVRISSQSYLRADGKKYALRSLDGLEADKETYLTDHGYVDAVFHFEPLPKDTKRFDFTEGDIKGAWELLGVEQASTRAGQLFPSNWRNTQTGDWEISFYDECAIYDCQFWNYKQKQQKDGKYTFVLENNGKEITVNVGNLKKVIRTIEIAGKKGNYDIINTPTLPDYPTKDTCTGFVDNGYQTDTVTLVGWLKDMPEWAWNKGREFNVEIWNIFNSDEQNTYSKMDSLGRFSIKIPVLNTSEAYIDWGRVTKATPLEPGKTYFLFKDFKTDQILWMGDDVRVQNEILAYGTHGFYVPTESEMDEETVMKFFEKVKEEKDSAMNKLQKVITEHPTVSDRYINYVKGDINTNEGRLLANAHFYIKNARLPMQILDYLSQQVWQQRIHPFTLFRDFKSFMSDYIEQFVSHRYREYLEDGRRYYYPYREQLFAPILRKYRDKMKITITDEELAIVSHYAKTHESIDEYAPIISRKDINKIIWEDEAPLLDLYYTLDIMDSIGCDQELRDIIITQELYFRNIKNYDTLTNCMIQFFEENVKMPAAKSFMKAHQERLLALQRGDLSNAASIKSAEDVANMTDGEKMLRKIIEPYKGKIILLDVWGTWCAPCKEALSHSQEEYERLKDYDIVYMYLANRSSDEAWKSVIKKYNVVGDNVVHYNLPKDQQQAIEHFIGVKAFPTYKLIDRDGNVLDVNADPRDLEALARLLEKM